MTKNKFTQTDLQLHEQEKCFDINKLIIILIAILDEKIITNKKYFE